LLECLEDLCASVGLERVTGVFGQTKRVAPPRRCGDLYDDMRDVCTAGDLPEPAVRVDPRSRVPAEVCSDLPAHGHETTATADEGSPVAKLPLAGNAGQGHTHVVPGATEGDGRHARGT